MLCATCVCDKKRGQKPGIADEDKREGTKRGRLKEQAGDVVVSSVTETETERQRRTSFRHDLSRLPAYVVRGKEKTDVPGSSPQHVLPKIPRARRTFSSSDSPCYRASEC